MFNSNLYFNPQQDNKVVIKSAIDSMKASNAILFLSIMTEKEVCQYCYRELECITKEKVIQLLANINKALVA